MKVTAACLAFVLQGCNSSLLRSFPNEGDHEDGLKDRKLVSAHITMSSPLNWYGYFPDILNPTGGSGFYCFNNVFETVAGGPTTPQFLVMFSDKYVEHKGKVYTVLPPWTEDDKGGLYEVTDSGGACVTLRLLYEDNYIGEIVASSKFDPIEIIAVDQVSQKIFGYYPDPAGSLLPWKRKDTGWGTAIDGTLAAEPVNKGEDAEVVCVSSDKQMCHLWGSGIDSFNFAKDGIECAPYVEAKPASIGDWDGFWAGSRGFYCPKMSNHQLSKWTWHGTGPVISDMGWEPAERIGRLSPVSNIYGVSTNGNLLALWDEKGVGVHSAPLHFPELTSVRGVGGLDNAYARGIFATNHEDRVYNVYWEGGWKIKEIPISYPTDGMVSVFFGNYDDATYVLWGAMPFSCTCPSTSFDIYRLDFVGGTDRYDAVHIQWGEVSRWSRNRFLKERELCL